VKSGAQKAKEEMEKQREKARLKKLEREQAQNQKAAEKGENKALKREALIGEIDKQLDLAVAELPQAPTSDADNKAMKLETAPEVEPVEAPAAPPPPQGVSMPAGGKPADKESVRKLFNLMDRSEKGQVSQRDVLVSLRKHPQVRLLFGLPVSGNEEGGENLEKRLLAIQDAFEGGSGLGELSAVFDELRQGSAMNFGREAFAASCRAGSLRAVAAKAAAILPREHVTGKAFVATYEWREVPEGAACPGGLEYKMDMESGKTMGRKPRGS